MKRFLILLVVLLIFLVGCGTGEGGGETEPVINYENVSEVNDSIEIMYYDINKLRFDNEEVINEINRISELYAALNDDEKALVTNYSYFEEILAKYEAFKQAEAEKEQQLIKLQKAVAKAAEYAKGFIPNKNNGETIELPNSYKTEDGIDVYIGWTSSDPQTIATNGQVVQPRNALTRVTLTAEARSGNVSAEVSSVVVVLPVAYTALPEKPVFAYYYSNLVGLTELERDTINVINLSFGDISDDGKVYVNGLNSSTILQERKNGIRVCFSVQDKEGFKKWTNGAVMREKLVNSFIDTCEKYHFDGVDIDWEYPEGQQEVNNYVEFIKLLYTKMKAKSKNYLVTSAMYGGNGVSKYNADVVYEYLDYIHLMTYDLNASDTSTHLTALGTGRLSSISVKKTIEYYTGAGIPKEKLVIGAAFYGKQFNISTSATSFTYQKCIGEPFTLTYSTIKNSYLSMIGTNSDRIKVVREWDSDGQAPYLCITEYGLDGNVVNKAFVTYDDAQSLTLKSQYVFDEGLGGLMFWELGSNDRDEDDLMQAIYDVFYK